jgi:hypothetical protein
MKTTLKIAILSLISIGFATLASAAPAGKGPNGMSYHRVDSHKSNGTLINGASCDSGGAKCCTPKGHQQKKNVRIGGK